MTNMMRIGLCSAILSAAVAVGARGQSVWYVDAGATGSATGSQWANAFTDLQNALAVALAGDEIWVARGVYTPSDTDATVSFTLRSGVVLYGGFAGSETLRSQRNWRANVTRLSGDIGRDDVPGSFTRTTPNSGHVLVGSGTDTTAILDGFTVSDGDTGPAGTPAGAPLMYGSGVYNIAGSPTIRNCTFTNNLAKFAKGAGIYNENSSPTIVNCTFVGNYVHLGDGGGIANYGACSPIIEDCLFRFNTVIAGPGGAVGAGLANWGTLPVTITRCTFENNLAMPFFPTGSDIAYGGGLWNHRGPMTVIDCAFTSNRSNFGGGFMTFGPATLVNCLFVNNESRPQRNGPFPEQGGEGGAIAASLANPGEVRVIGCTITANRGKKYVGLYSGWNGHAIVEDTIIWANRATHPDFIGYWTEQIGGSFDASYSCIRLIFAPPAPGEDPIDPANLPGCIDLSPSFAGAGNYRLGAGSPCIDAGDNLAVLAGIQTDLDGLPRFADDPATPNTGRGTAAMVDMGAYEFPVESCYADCDPSTGVGVLDLFDFLCFQGSFVAGEAYACDCDTSTGPLVCDLFDFLCFQSAFVGGCP